MSNKFNCYTHSEGRTGEGQLVEFSCRSEDVEKIKQTLLDVRLVELPQTYSVNIPHGSYGQYSRFKIKQHKYAGGGNGGGGGYIEVLEISNPPDNRCGFVVHEYHVGEGHCFTEWDSIGEAVIFFDKTWGSLPDKTDNFLKQFSGFKREVKCHLLVPWFYAVGEEGLIGDFAFPHGLQDDPVFRFGVRCVVPNGDENLPDGLSIKTCMGCRVFETDPGWNVLAQRRPEKEMVRIILWDDGTCYDSRKQTDSDFIPRPLREDELWVDEVMRQFRRLLSGGQKQFTINFTGGGRFVGRFLPGKNMRQDPPGRYLGEVVFMAGKSVKGLFDFTPTKNILTAEAMLREKFDTKGKIIKSIKITRQANKTGGRKWTGVFFVKE